MNKTIIKIVSCIVFTFLWTANNILYTVKCEYSSESGESSSSETISQESSEDSNIKNSTSIKTVNSSNSYPLKAVGYSAITVSSFVKSPNCSENDIDNDKNGCIRIIIAQNWTDFVYKNLTSPDKDIETEASNDWGLQLNSNIGNNGLLQMSSIRINIFSLIFIFFAMKCNMLSIKL